MPLSRPIRASVRARAYRTLGRILALTLSGLMRTSIFPIPCGFATRSLEVTVRVAIETHLVSRTGFVPRTKCPIRSAAKEGLTCLEQVVCCHSVLQPDGVRAGFLPRVHLAEPAYLHRRKSISSLCLSAANSVHTSLRRLRPPSPQLST